MAHALYSPVIDKVASCNQGGTSYPQEVGMPACEVQQKVESQETLNGEMTPSGVWAVTGRHRQFQAVRPFGNGGYPHLF